MSGQERHLTKCMKYFSDLASISIGRYTAER
jgi:hypothetical protein